MKEYSTLEIIVTVVTVISTLIFSVLSAKVPKDKKKIKVVGKKVRRNDY